MFNRSALLVPFFAAFILLLPAVAQQPDVPNQSTSICTFEDGNEISIRYQSLDFNKKNEMPFGKPWAPNGNPILLFTPTNLTIGNTTVPTGAYSVYTIRNRNDWTLVINKSVAQGAAYDASQDVVRVNMEMGKLTSANKPLNISLGHIKPKVCSMQIVFGDTGAWADLAEK